MSPLSSPAVLRLAAADLRDRIGDTGSPAPLPDATGDEPEHARQRGWLIARIPEGHGREIRVAWMPVTEQAGPAHLTLRVWRSRPDGFMYPQPGVGLYIPAAAVPALAEAVATALELAAQPPASARDGR